MAATAPELRGRGLAGLTAARLRAWCEAELDRPGFAFAYVEAETALSLLISDDIGHALEAELPLSLFARLRPRRDARVEPAAEADRAELLQRLDALHSDHEFADFEESLTPADCLVLRDGGRIAAAVQTELLRWSVVSLPGVAGGGLLRLMRALPAGLRPLDPADLRVVRFGAVLAEPGDEAALSTLMEDALARHEARLGLLMMDRRSPVLGRVLAQGRRGALACLLRGSARLRADFVGVSEEDLARLRSRPALVSPADVF